MDFELGQVVFSKRGRDRGTAYVVVGLFTADKQYAYLADGKRRTADKPKKKKVIHIQPTKAVVTISNRGDPKATDAEIRKSLKAYCEKDTDES